MSPLRKRSYSLKETNSLLPFKDGSVRKTQLSLLHISIDTTISKVRNNLRFYNMLAYPYSELLTTLLYQ